MYRDEQGRYYFYTGIADRQYCGDQEGVHAALTADCPICRAPKGTYCDTGTVNRRGEWIPGEQHPERVSIAMTGGKQPI